MTHAQDEVRTRPASRLAWFCRRHAWVIALSALLGALAGLALATLREEEPVYQAEALVVARELTIRDQALPSYVETVFGAGAVARAVAADPAVDADPESLIPGRLSVVAGPDSIVFRVHARDGDPAVAARLANAAAYAAVAELNKPGTGVARFGVQTEAQPPAAALAAGVGPLAGLAVGGVAGALFGLGLLLALAVVRRPVTEAEEVRGILGVPVVAAVTLPRTPPRAYAGPGDVPGLAALVRLVTERSGDTVALAAVPGAARDRRRLAVALAAALRRHGDVVVDAEEDVRAAAESARVDGVAGAATEGTSSTGSLRLVDGVDLLTQMDRPAGSTALFLLVPEGYPSQRLRRYSDEVFTDDVTGAVLVRHGRDRARELLRSAGGEAGAARRKATGLERGTAGPQQSVPARPGQTAPADPEHEPADAGERRTVRPTA